MSNPDDQVPVRVVDRRWWAREDANAEAGSDAAASSTKPTYVEDLAKGIAAIIEKKRTGVYHLSGKEILTPYQIACKTAEHLQLDPSLIKKVTAADLHSVAKRPKQTVFIIDKAELELNYKPVSFDEGLKNTFT